MFALLTVRGKSFVPAFFARPLLLLLADNADTVAPAHPAAHAHSKFLHPDWCSFLVPCHFLTTIRPPLLGITLFSAPLDGHLSTQAHSQSKDSRRREGE